MSGSSPDSLTGFVNLYKPDDMTSSDAVCIVRGVLSRVIGGRQKAGHLGTLDPLAEGVLPIALGKATRLFDLLAFKTKRYKAQFTFGTATDTLDRGGKTVSVGGRIPLREEIEAVLPRFIGETEQIPPAFSAKSVDGKRAYAYARQGVAPDLPPKRIRIDSFELTGGEDGTFNFDIECGGGTYIRALARDVATALGTTAYMSALTRTRSGVFTVENSVSLDLFRNAPENCIIPVEYALTAYPEKILDGRETEKILNGIPVRCETTESLTAKSEFCEEIFRVKAEDGVLLGIGKSTKDGLKLTIRL